MDLTGIMASQIAKTDQENKLREERFKQERLEQDRMVLEQDRRVREIREAEEKVGAIKFLVVKNKIEKSHIRGVLETLARELNSSNPDFALLKARIVELIRRNPHGEITDNPEFFVSKPYDYDGKNHDVYVIWFFTGGHQGIQYNNIFSVTFSGKINHFSFKMDLAQCYRIFVLNKTDPESLARNIINYIMSE